MKKVRILLILLALIIQMFVGTPLQVFAADVTSRIKTLESTFTIKDNLGDEILPESTGIYTNIPRDSEIELYYSFEILDESESGDEYSYSEGDTVVVQLPPELSYVVPVDGLDIVDAESESIMGILTVASDGEATITFTDFVENNSGMQAWFRINGTFSEDTLGLPINTPINLEFDGEIIQVGIQEPVLPDVTINMTKSGVYDKDTNEIIWTINVTSSGLIYNIDLIDTMSANHAFVLGSMTVGGVSVTPTAVGNAWTYVLSELNGTSTIIYRSKPVTNIFNAETNSVTSTRFDNSVKAEKNDIEKASASASVTTDWINKSGARDANDRNLFHWTITVNSMDAPMTNAVIVDTLPAGLEVVPSSFRLRLPNGTRISLTENATLTPGFYTLVEGTEVGPLKSTTIYYAFNGTITEDHALEFDSRVIDPLALSSNTTINYYNTATLSWDNGNLGSPTDGATVGTQPGTIISKSVTGNNQNYDYLSNNISTWTVTLNSQGLNPIENASFEDIVPNGSEYVDGTFVVSYTINGSSINIGTMSYDALSRKLTYIFTNPVTTTIYIRYQTRVVNLALFERNGNVRLTNSATFIGNQILGGQQTVARDKNYSSQMFAKNIEVPLYNYSTREITWRLVINRNQIPQSTVVVTDLVPAGLRLLPESITVTAGEVYVLSTVVQNSGNISDRDSLRFEFASIDNQVIIMYKTVAEEGLLLIDGNKSLTNSAAYSSSTIPSLTASATATIINPLVTKTGNYESGSDFIRWGVTINPNAVRLSDVQLIDDLQTGLRLDVTSVVLYEMTLQANGSLVQSTTALDSSYYSVSYDELTNRFIFSFTNPIDRPYRLEFVTDILVQNLSVQNSIRLSGVGQTYNSTASTISVVVAEDDLSGGGTGIKGSIQIRKGDKADTNISLAGAVFGLYNTAGVKLVELTTDVNGYATFSNLGMRTYTIVELSAPYGYSIDPTPIRVRLNSTVPNATTEQFNDMLTGTITLNKVLLDYNGDTISSSDPFVVTLMGPSYPSGQVFNVYAGVPLEIDNLLIGQYSVTEQNSEGYDVTISGIADISFENLEETITITNQESRASMRVRKVVQYSNGAIDNRNQFFDITVKGPSYPSGERFTINNQTDLVLEGLLFGEYEIKELEAFAYTITIDGNTELTEASRTTLITITNRRRPDSELPQTGLDPILWPSILGGFFIFIGFITRKKKKNKTA